MNISGLAAFGAAAQTDGSAGASPVLPGFADAIATHWLPGTTTAAPVATGATAGLSLNASPSLYLLAQAPIGAQAAAPAIPAAAASLTPAATGLADQLAPQLASLAATDPAPTQPPALATALATAEPGTNAPDIRPTMLASVSGKALLAGEAQPASPAPAPAAPAKISATPPQALPEAKPAQQAEPTVPVPAPAPAAETPEEGENTPAGLVEMTAIIQVPAPRTTVTAEQPTAAKPPVRGAKSEAPTGAAPQPAPAEHEDAPAPLATPQPAPMPTEAPVATSSSKPAPVPTKAQPKPVLQPVALAAAGATAKPVSAATEPEPLVSTTAAQPVGELPIAPTEDATIAVAAETPGGSDVSPAKAEPATAPRIRVSAKAASPRQAAEPSIASAPEAERSQPPSGHSRIEAEDKAIATPHRRETASSQDQAPEDPLAQVQAPVNADPAVSAQLVAKPTQDPHPSAKTAHADAPRFADTAPIQASQHAASGSKTASAAEPVAASNGPDIAAEAPHHPSAAPSFASLVDGNAPVGQAATATPATAAAAPARNDGTPVVSARAGEIGHELGVEIARRVSAGRDELLVKLNPEHLGRIEVRMAFDDTGTLRAVVQADSPAALDLLRRDSADLTRSLADAGVRADAQSFRFDGRGSGDGGQPRQQQPQRAADTFADAGTGVSAEDVPELRRVRSSGTVDLLA